MRIVLTVWKHGCFSGFSAGSTLSGFASDGIDMSLVARGSTDLLVHIHVVAVCGVFTYLLTYLRLAAPRHGPPTPQWLSAPLPLRSPPYSRELSPLAAGSPLLSGIGALHPGKASPAARARFHGGGRAAPFGGGGF